jgi:transposase-like protein
VRHGKWRQFSFPGEDWVSTNEPSRFSREFKLEALRRMEAGENVSVLAQELGVSRKSIYQWAAHQ